MIKYGRHSMYYKAVQIEDGEDRLTLDSDKKVPWNLGDTIDYVEQGEMNRLDLVAYRKLGNPLLWWVIARRNNIKFPFKANVGRELYIPTGESIYGTGGVLSE